MERKKRTITVKETATLLSLKLKSNEMRRGWCAECRAEVGWIELSKAIEWLKIIDLHEKGVIHLNFGRVCWRSLIERTHNTSQ